MALFGDFAGMAGMLGAAGINMAAELGATDMTNKSNEKIATETNAANVLMTRETNAANVQNVESTNETNLQIAQEANALAVQESEKSYERSTATNQIAELMRAGFSAQEAKTIVAAGGSSPSYTAAPVQAAQMQAAQQVAPQMQPWTKQKPDLSGMYSSLSALGQGVFDSLSDPNGGALGAVLANDPAAEVFSHKGDDGFNIDDARTVADFEEYAKGHADDPEHWSQKLVHSKQWQRLKKTPAGMKGYAAYMTSYASTGTQFENFRDSQQKRKQAEIQTRLDTINEKVRTQGLALEERELNWKDKNFDVLHDADIMEVNNKIAVLGMDADVLKNPAYRDAYMSWMLQDKKTQEVVARALETRTKGTLEAYKANSTFYDTAGLLDSVGFTNGEIMSVCSFFMASGLPVVDRLQEALAALGLTNESADEIDSNFDDPSNQPDVISPDDYSAWWHKTRFRRFFKGYSYDYQPFRDSDGNVKYRKVAKTPVTWEKFWQSPSGQ